MNGYILTPGQQRMSECISLIKTKKKESWWGRKGLLHHNRQSSTETSNKTPGLPSLVNVDAAEEVDEVELLVVELPVELDVLDELEVPLRAIAVLWKAEKFWGDDSSELIAL